MKKLAFSCIALACLAACSDTLNDAEPWSVSEATPNNVESPTPPDTTDTPPPSDTDVPPPPDVDVEPMDTALSGNWIQSMIGNCIDIENWLVFGPAGAMEHIVADRNACYTHHLLLGSGEWSSSANELEYEWQAEDRWERRLMTYMLTDDGQTLQTAAYVRDGDAFVRVDEREGSMEPYYSHAVRVEVTFDEPLAAEGCHMAVSINAEIDLGANAAPLVAEELFRFDCEKTVQESGRLVVAAPGNVGDRWIEEFRRRGIWDRYEPVMGELLYRSFRPGLSFESAEATVAFTPGVYEGAWRRTVSEPARTMQELEERL